MDPATPATPSPWRERLLNGLCWFMALEFVVGGATKFVPDSTPVVPDYAEKFVAWGYPSWFRFLVGAAEIVAAGLLVNRRTRFLAGGMLVVILVGAVVTHVANQDPVGQAIAAPTHLLLAAIVAWSYRDQLLSFLRQPAPAQHAPG
jgi:uncharacterized membrane protein YphA (DoxX/SURF4 family)